MPIGIYPRRPISEQHRRNLSKAMMGHSVSTETRRKISEATKGKRKWTEKQRKLLTESARNRKHSPETRARMSVAHKGKKLTSEHRRKVALAHLGALNPQWKGGITSINEQIRKSIEYKTWRAAVLERDAYTCVICGSKRKLEADHIKTFAEFPELRLELSNGRTLCRSCHQTTDTWGTNVNRKAA